jgi:hypothetical protein
MKNDENIKEVLSDIRAQLNEIEEHLQWSLFAEQRFRIGDKVEWSRKARRQGFPRRKVAQRGVIKGMNGFNVVVQLLGTKKSQKFHHAFFNPVYGPHLF